jgi:hypothetical protein
VSSPRDRDRALDPALAPAGSSALAATSPWPTSNRRDLTTLVERLLRERSWNTLTALFVSIGTGEEIAPAALSDLDAAAQRVAEALDAVSHAAKPVRGAQLDELRALRLAVADALMSRTAHPPLADVERRALERAATFFEHAGDHRRAALAYEELGADLRAADAWGALGDLDRMEAAHAREDQRAAARRGAGEIVHRFEALLAAGERRRALATLAPGGGLEEAAPLRQRVAELESRLCRGHAVGLRLPGGTWARAAVLPSEIGRDPGAGVPLRDPSVSRRHALLAAGDGAVHITDPGSRGGIRLGGARLAAGASFPLPEAGELALGPTTVLRFQATPTTLILEAASGLDRGLRALVGIGPLALAQLFPAADGLALQIEHDLVRLARRADLAVRVEGQFIGPGCDLLHGDVIEVPSRGLRLEVQ